MKTENLKGTSLPLDKLLYRKGILVIRAVNHPLRQQMLNLMHQKGRISVSEIYIKLRLEQSVASQHLAVLRNAHYVKTEREGKHIYYSVNYGMLNEANRVVKELVVLKQ